MAMNLQIARSADFTSGRQFSSLPDGLKGTGYATVRYMKSPAWYDATEVVTGKTMLLL